MIQVELWRASNKNVVGAIISTIQTRLIRDFVSKSRTGRLYRFSTRLYLYFGKDEESYQKDEKFQEIIESKN